MDPNPDLGSIVAIKLWIPIPYPQKNQGKDITGWWLNQPIWKNISEIGSFPQVGVKIENIWNHHLAYNDM